MRTSKVLSFEELLANGVSLDDSQIVSFDKVEIPKIQRAYAQGRNDAVNVRDGILKNIFDSLEQDKEIQFSFIYGSKSDTWNSFELLDGQQRLTTLFLVHWYILKVEADELPDYLTKFSYQTRDSSKIFIENLCNKKDLSLKGLEGDLLIPSKVIKGFKWFTDEFLCDATVVSMLNMLDAIYEKYKELENHNLATKLHNLKFYALLLESFELSEELYIKMNSRGLKLTPFENYKADVINFIEKNSYYKENDVKYDGNPFDLIFSARIDSQWVDIFWENLAKDKDGEAENPVETDDFLTNVRYLRFFKFFFLAKSFVHKFDNVEHLRDFFNVSCNGVFTENELKQEYESFECFDAMLSKHPDYLEKIAFLLDFLLAYYKSDIRDFLQNPYDHISDEKKWDFFDKPNMTANQLFIWIVLVEFVDAMQESKIKIRDFTAPACHEVFKQYMHIAWNVNENTTFEHVDEVETPAQIFSKLIHQPNNFSGDFLKNVSTDTCTSNSQYQEEKIKAGHIISHTTEDWESAFAQAERHPFFRGAINFFFDTSLSKVSDFDARVAAISPLFEKNGVADAYRTSKEHILLRAILSTCNTWGRLSSLQISEGTVERKLKNFLRDDAAVQKVFKDFFSQTTFATYEDYFKDVVAKAMPLQSESLNFKTVFNRIVVDKKSSKIIDWLGTSTFIRFKAERDGNILVGLNKKKYNWLVLDDERTAIINSMIANDGFLLLDNSNNDFFKTYNSIGYYFFTPQIHKVIQSKNKEIIITFDFKKKANFGLKDLNTGIIEAKESIPCESIAQDYPKILANVQQIENALV